MNLKKILAGVLACCVMGGALPPVEWTVDKAVITANAADYTSGTYESLTYKKYNDYIEISGCDKSTTEVVIPDEIEGVPVTDIGERAFEECSGLTEITIPNSVTSIGEGAFYNCKNLKSVKLSSSVTSISDYCFLNCEKMTKCDIPEGVEWIGQYAFENTGLTTIVLPSTLSFCHEWHSFCYNENLTEFVVTEGNEEYATVDGVLVSKNSPQILCYPSGREGAYTVPEGYSLNFETFAGCRKLTSLTLPDSFNFNYSFLYFNDCDQLTALNVSDTHSELKSVDGILYTKDGTEIVRVPNGIKGAFTIPNGVTTVWSDSFSGIKAITEVVVPANVTRIEYYAFSAMEGLTSITIENPNCIIEGDKYTIYNSLVGYNTKFTGIIYGYEGSTAQEYAEKYGYKFAVIGAAPEKPTEKPTEKTTAKPTEKPTEPKTTEKNTTAPTTGTPDKGLLGDANCDGKVSIADSTAILQALGNPDKYGLSEQGAKNADCCDPGDGVKTSDALTIQKLDAKVITKLPETTENK